MAELIELVFEKIKKEDIKFFMNYLITIGKPYHMQYVNRSENNVVEKDLINNSILDAINLKSIDYILVKFSNLHIHNLSFNNVDVWVKHYDNDMDISILFEHSDLELFMSNCVNLLMKFAQELCNKFDVETYYCGLDPACDEETRFFTEKSIGPLR